MEYTTQGIWKDVLIVSAIAQLVKAYFRSQLYLIPLDPDRSPTSGLHGSPVASTVRSFIFYVSVRLGYAAQLSAQTPV